MSEYIPPAMIERWVKAASHPKRREDLEELALRMFGDYYAIIRQQARDELTEEQSHVAAYKAMVATLTSALERTRAMLPPGAA